MLATASGIRHLLRGVLWHELGAEWYCPTGLALTMQSPLCAPMHVDMHDFFSLLVYCPRGQGPMVDIVTACGDMMMSPGSSGCKEIKVVSATPCIVGS